MNGFSRFSVFITIFSIAIFANNSLASACLGGSPSIAPIFIMLDGVNTVEELAELKCKASVVYYDPTSEPGSKSMEVELESLVYKKIIYSKNSEGHAWATPNGEHVQFYCPFMDEWWDEVVEGGRKTIRDILKSLE